MEKGIEKGMALTIEIYKLSQAGRTVEEISEAVGLTVEEVATLLKSFSQ